jgi:pSer/pThr/pTyr-binding forkhead associated (FHA) protein
MASLTIIVEGVEQRIPLESAAVTLGRGLESDVRLKDIKASRRHCQVVKTSKGYQCVDLSSGNGTYVNGVQIKTQLLGSGDKITIGSTTILFEEAAKPSVSSKAATSKIPVAAPPAPAPSKTATAKIQVAPTRRTTSRADAGKPASQAALKPVAPPPSKSGTRVGKVTGRAPTVRPTRPAAEAPRKKKSPVIAIVAVAVVLVLAAGGFFFFRSKDNSDDTRSRVEHLMKKAHDEEASGKTALAVQDYNKALQLCQGDLFKQKARDITQLLAQLEASQAPAPAVKADPKEPAKKGPDVQARRSEISQKYKLTGDAASADWGGALKEWNDFLSKKPAAEAEAAAQEEIRSIQGKAKADLERLRKKAAALVQENKMAEAVALLKQQEPRFEGSEALPDLEAAIKQYDR